ncbi:MAG: rhamnulokinase [Clostridia bacterium]|nr:rhamnulokinase [Clostridia bacterium]
MPYCLAIDIGASSGRHLLGELKNGKLETTEIYRFENGMKEQNGALTWDIAALTDHVIAGIAKCRELGKIPATIAIDTWGVDYVLLDGCDKEILPCYAYRDSRTAHCPDEVFSILPENELYAKTGIQKQCYNTLYQLYADKKAGRLAGAKSFLLMPEYLSFKLTGVKAHEYTICSTTNLLNAEAKTWDFSIVDTLGLPRELFGEILPPAAPVGALLPEIAARVGFDATVVFCPSHDTAAAVAACPLTDGSAFISSGTWSLVGTELTSPTTSALAQAANLTNEGGIDYRYRFLKNIMGMWLFQSIRKELGKKYTYDEMMHMAEESTFTECIDPTDAAFLAPASMIEAVRTDLGKPDLPLGDLLSSVYHSLASSYKRTVEEIESISGEAIHTVAIVGGGCKDDYLNRLTARYTGKRVSAGPVECTATGNILAQLMYLDPSLSSMAARDIVRNTYKDDIKYYEV